MEWHGAMINMLRVLIGDNTYSGAYVYTDSRLIETLVVAAMYTAQEIKFATDYTIDVIYSTISPDPYVTSDRTFMNMTALKAACIIDQGTYRTKAVLSGLEAKCGPTTLKTLNHLDGFKELLSMGPCAMFDKLKLDYEFSGDGLNNIIHFVLSPFAGNDFDPVDSFQTYYYSERMIR